MTSNFQDLKDSVAYENLLVFRDKLITSIIDNIDSSELEKACEDKNSPKKGKNKVIRSFATQLKEYFRKRFEV